MFGLNDMSRVPSDLAGQGHCVADLPPGEKSADKHLAIWLQGDGVNVPAPARANVRIEGISHASNWIEPRDEIARLLPTNVVNCPPIRIFPSGCTTTAKGG